MRTFTVEIMTSMSQRELEEFVKSLVNKANDSRYRGFGWSKPIKGYTINEKSIQPLRILEDADD